MLNGCFHFKIRAASGWGLGLAVGLAGMMPGFVPCGCAQITKGHQILINRGLQVQGMVAASDGFHLTTYTNAYYTSIHWLWDSNPSLMGVAPGFPWSRWVLDETKVPPQGSESAYLGQLVSLQLGDEWSLNDEGTRTRAVTWFNNIRANFPNTILFMNNFGGQVGDAQLGDFITRAQPDMLAFDTYPWRSDYTTRTPLLGPPTSWYGDARRYREHAKDANLPLAVYIQTFRAVQDYDQTVYRDPSPSELRLNHSAALAFNAKVLIDFTYNTGASSLFTGGGDNAPTPLFTDKTDANRRARNLGRALVRLTPIADAPGPYTTSILFIRGRNASGTPSTVPIGFVADPQTPSANTDWEFGRNDPYLTGWTVTNKSGLKNGGQPGDVIMAWFTPLEESLDGPFYSGEVYLMIVNALTDPTGTAADCLQEIRLNFALPNDLPGVVLLDPATGQLQTNSLPTVNGHAQMVLNLNGGDAALFKFADGAPFVGWPVPGAPRLSLIPMGAVWKHLDNGSNPGTNWRTTNFDDSAWASGCAMLGYGDANGLNPCTTNRYGPDPTNKYITTYYRHTFSLPNPAVYNSLEGSLQRDDGAVVYLNGVEIFRSNMPTGAIDYLTLASTNVSGADEATFYPFTASAAGLRAGANVLAVEIHQQATNSSDIAFDLQLAGLSNFPPRVSFASPASGSVVAPGALSLVAAASDPENALTGVAFFANGLPLGLVTHAPYSLVWSNALPGHYRLTAEASDARGLRVVSAPVVITLQGQHALLAQGAAWQYWDRTNYPGDAWRTLNFNDGAWSNGQARLGYGGDGEITQVTSNRARITTYFRHSFVVADPALYSNPTMRLQRDDGAVVWLNGFEVWRSNLSNNIPVLSDTLATNAVAGAEEQAWFTNALDPSRLQAGTNLLAVEVHQNGTNSSDLGFDFELRAQAVLPAPSLKVALHAGRIQLAWPSWAGDAQLFETTNLVWPARWTLATNSAQAGLVYWQVELAPGGAARFFQLHQP